MVSHNYIGSVNDKESIFDADWLAEGGIFQ